MLEVLKKLSSFNFPNDSLVQTNKKSIVQLTPRTPFTSVFYSQKQIDTKCLSLRSWGFFGKSNNLHKIAKFILIIKVKLNQKSFVIGLCTVNLYRKCQWTIST